MAWQRMQEQLSVPIREVIQQLPNCCPLHVQAGSLSEAPDECQGTTEVTGSSCLTGHLCAGLLLERNLVPENH